LGLSACAAVFLAATCLLPVLFAVAVFFIPAFFRAAACLVVALIHGYPHFTDTDRRTGRADELGSRLPAPEARLPTSSARLHGSALSSP
jgi:hypothetical protein